MERLEGDVGFRDDVSVDSPTVEPLASAKERALNKFMEIGTVKGACAAAGVPRRTWYNWMETDKSFAIRVVQASEQVSDELEEEAIRRAKDGSDTLLMFLLKARRPAIFREKRTIEVVSPDVQRRLAKQVEFIMATIKRELPSDQATRLIGQLADGLTVVWDTGEVPA